MGDQAEQAEGHDGASAQSVTMQTSNRMIRMYKELFGRGPKKAQSHFAGADVLLCSLYETLTPAERSMVEMGEHQRLRDTRMYFQYATDDKFREAIEEITGRRVIGFISGIDTAADIATELFYLEPQSTSGF
jgi:uncharacterized protein YbcI